MTARDALDRALLELAANGRRVRCAEPEDHLWWTSDHDDERARAARLCTGCPLLRPCALAAEEEKDQWTTRGGVDRRHRPTKKEKSK